MNISPTWRQRQALFMHGVPEQPPINQEDTSGGGGTG